MPVGGFVYSGFLSDFIKQNNTVYTYAIDFILNYFLVAGGNQPYFNSNSSASSLYFTICFSVNLCITINVHPKVFIFRKT